MKALTTGILVVAALTAGVIGVLGPGLVQHAMATGSASSTGASTALGSAGSSAAGNFFTGGSTSSSAAGGAVECVSQGVTPASACIGVR